MRTIPIPRRALRAPVESKRLLALAADERLVARIRRGSDIAFEVAFERHGPGILSFCRHMLGGREEAEDAVQHTFAAAYHALHRDDREIALKPWLYTIARNRSLSVLRARRDEVGGDWEVPTEGLAEQVENRAELRELLEDLHDLPDQQRAALLLAEIGDMSHADVAGILGCQVHRVKRLIFQARTGLIQRREARATPCEAIREQLASARGGSLRRNELRHHLAGCPGCTSFREQIRRQRGMLAVALPVMPGVSLKASVLAATGIGGGSAAAGGTAGMAGATLTKLLVAGALAGGGAVTSTAIVDRTERPAASASPPAERAARPEPRSQTPAVVPAASPADDGRERASIDDRPRAGSAPRSQTRLAPASARRHRESAPPDRQARPGRSEPRPEPPAQSERPAPPAEPPAGSNSRGRGPVERPPRSTPVRRGPPAGVPASPKAAAPAPPGAPAGQPPAEPPKGPPAVKQEAGKPAAPQERPSRAPGRP